MVLFKSVLGGAIERQNRNRSVHANRGESPTTPRAVPAFEVILFNPHHTLIHRHTRTWIVFGWNSRQRRGTEEDTSCLQPGKFTYYASPNPMSHELLMEQSN